MKLSKRFIAYTYLLINVLTWGAALPIVKMGLGTTTPFRYLTYRFLIAAVLSIPILLFYAPKIKNLGRQLQTIIAIELLGTTLGLTFLYIGLSRTSALEASLIATTTPIFITLGGVWFLKEKEEKNEWIGLSIAFVGTLGMTFLPSILSGAPLFAGTFVGNALVFCNNIIAAMYFILAKKYFKKLPKLFVTAVSFFVGLFTFGLFSFFEAGSNIQNLLSGILLDLSFPSVWIIAFYMAVFGSIIGLTAYIKGQDGIEASEASLFGYLQPLVYIPLSFFLLQESVSPIQIGCLLLILTGVILAERRSTKRKRKIR